MFKFFLVIFFILFLGVYIYFGYYQDYKRQPKEFIRSIIGMPLGLAAQLLGFKQLDQKLKDWANNTKK